MWFRAAAVFLLSSLALPALSAPATQAPPLVVEWDVIVIGGGPSGLSALSGLARVRRKVLLIDSGEYRNAATRHLHDLIGLDGVTPAYYRWLAREQLKHYSTISMQNGTVTKIEGQNNNTFFQVSCDLGGRPVVTTAKKIVLGTGLRDLLPDTPGFRENWANGIYWCPWCDGHEHADQRLGLIGPFDEIAGMVREVLTLNKDIVAFVNGTDSAEARVSAEQKSPQWAQYLGLHNVTVYNQTIAAFERLADGTTGHEDPSLPSVAEHDRFRVKFADGTTVDRDAFMVSVKNEQRSKVGQEAGVELLGGRLKVDNAKGLVTSVFGIYAVGDCNSDNSTNIPHALNTGKRAAVFAHVQIERETQAQELAALGKPANLTKRSLDLEARSVWEKMNGRSDELLYGGEFEQ